MPQLKPKVTLVHPKLGYLDMVNSDLTPQISLLHPKLSNLGVVHPSDLNPTQYPSKSLKATNLILTSKTTLLHPKIQLP